MNVIYKYPLEPAGDQIIELPQDYEILTLQTQNNIPCLWIKVSLNSPLKYKIRVRIYGTGELLELKDEKYVGSYQLFNGSFVGHVFVKE